MYIVAGTTWLKEGKKGNPKKVSQRFTMETRISVSEKLAYRHIKYKKGFKYQLTQASYTQTPIFSHSVKTRYFELYIDGVLYVKAGYAWDGPSGPTPDIKSFMRGSMIHDVIYQMLRMELIDEKHKETADTILYDLCVEDGMWKSIAWIVQKMVNRWGFMSTHPDKLRREYTAP